MKPKKLFSLHAVVLAFRFGVVLQVPGASTGRRSPPSVSNPRSPKKPQPSSDFAITLGLVGTHDLSPSGRPFRVDVPLHSVGCDLDPGCQCKCQLCRQEKPWTGATVLQTWQMALNHALEARARGRRSIAVRARHLGRLGDLWQLVGF